MSNLKNFFREYKFSPSKKLGQVFLTDQNILKKIEQATMLKKEDTVLEIGAGFGNLTQVLAQKAKKVIAVEKDKKMVEILKEKFKDFKNVEILEGDVRDLLESVTQNLKDYKIVGNIPYYLTSNLIRRILELKNKPKVIILMVQKEVAERIVARKKLNLLAISVAFYAKAKIFHFVSKNCFFPRPKVDSAILQIFPQTPLFENEKIFFKIVKAGFLHKRKKILKNLERGLKLNKEEVKELLKNCKIEETKRAEDLSLKDWINLAKEFLKKTK